MAKISETVQLPLGRLSEAAIDGHKIVPVDRRCASSDGACWPLSPIVLITGDTLFWRNIRTDHLEQVELRRDLEERAAIFRRLVQSANVTRHCSKLDASINVLDRFGVVEVIGENSPFPIGA